jgi:hypothetical protein
MCAVLPTLCCLRAHLAKRVKGAVGGVLACSASSAALLPGAAAVHRQLDLISPGNTWVTGPVTTLVTTLVTTPVTTPVTTLELCPATPARRQGQRDAGEAALRAGHRRRSAVPPPPPLQPARTHARMHAHTRVRARTHVLMSRAASCSRVRPRPAAPGTGRPPMLTFAA